MKKKTILISLAFLLFLIGFLFFTSKNCFFRIPNNFDSVEVVTYNYSLPPKYGSEKIKTYTSNKELETIKQTFSKLKLGNKNNKNIAGTQNVEIFFYKNKRELKRFVFSGDTVIKNSDKYNYNSKEIDSLLDTLSE